MSSKTFLIWYKFYKFYTFTCKFWDECCTSSTSSIRFGVWLRHWHDRRDDKQRRQHQVVKQTEHIRRSYRCVIIKKPIRTGHERPSPVPPLLQSWTRRSVEWFVPCEKNAHFRQDHPAAITSTLNVGGSGGKWPANSLHKMGVFL